MDYEKKYKNALEWARQVMNGEIGFVRDEVQEIFSELAEAEDERIKKEIVRFIQMEVEDEIVGNKWIAWLEKQGDKDKLIKELGEYKVKYTQEVLSQYLEKQCEKMKAKSEVIKDYTGEENVWNNAHDFRPKHLQRCICYDKYMKGVYCYVYDDISKYWCTQTTEEHDPDGDNHICDYADYRVTVWMSLPDTSFYPSKSLLEKQGEKPQGKSALEAAKEEKVNNSNSVYGVPFDYELGLKTQKGE